MIRETIGQALDHDPDFRWRGQSVTRIENLSDIAFALALGMIITGVDAPRTYGDLVRFLIFAVPAAAGFAVLLGVWTSHYTFFRRYGVADKTIIFLNAILIFLVLYMAYPLRFTFDALYAWIMALSTGETSRFLEIGVMDLETSGRIIAIFSVVYALIFGVLALMNRHIIRKAKTLDLSSYELAVTQRDHFANLLRGGLSVVVAGLGYFTALNGFSGVFLCLLGAADWIAAKRYPAVSSSQAD